MSGRLDGLHLQPLVDADGKLTHVHCTVDTLPGLRLIVEAAAVAEMHAALGALLGQHGPQPSDWMDDPSQCRWPSGRRP